MSFWRNWRYPILYGVGIAVVWYLVIGLIAHQEPDWISLAIVAVFGYRSGQKDG